VQETRFTTEFPGRFILKLCKHFRHKVPAEFDEHSGRVDFKPGLCFLTAKQTALHLRIEGSSEQELGRMRFILEDHIKRMGRLDTLELQWTEAGS
jgi:hypothetical protein